MKFCLAIHNHQSLGSTDEEIRQAYEKAWLPFLMMVRERQALKMCVYNNGVVWDWLLENGSDYVAALGEMVKSKRVEILGGGAYEPLLTLLSEEDALAQVGRLSRTIDEKFDVLPEGVWLEESLWQPQLPTMLTKADVKYMVVDESLCHHEALGPFVVEDRGACLRLFPVSEGFLSGSISASEIVQKVSKLHEEQAPGLMIIGVDASLMVADKPGAEPQLPVELLGTFLDNLDKLAQDDKTALPSEFIEEGYSGGRLWPKSQDTVSLRENIARRPSVDGLYRKMLHVSRKIQFSGRTTREIREALMKGQCATSILRQTTNNRSYRRAVWQELLTAEDLVDARLHGKGSWVDVEEIDYNGDGEKELLVSSRQVNAYFSPKEGGTAFELDFKPRRANVLDNVAKHNSVFQRAFVDIFPQSLKSAEDARKLLLSSSDFDPFGEAESRIVSDRDTRVVFTREATIPAKDGENKLSLEKTFRFAADQPDFKVRYRLINRGPEPIEQPFCVAFGFRSPCGTSLADALLVDSREIGDVCETPFAKEMAQDVTIEDRQIGYRLRLQFTMCSNLFVVPVEWPQEPCGGVGIVTMWEGPLPKGEILELDMAVEFEALECSDA